MGRYFVSGLSKAQREAFEQIAVGNALPAAHPKTLQKLKDKGLIEEGLGKTVGWDCFGAIVLPQYYVPLPVHMGWCKWCSEHPDIELEADHG
jgi:hypothetical protein